MSAVTDRLAEGMAILRTAFYYKETKRKNGSAYPQTLLGKAEARFMATNPTRQGVEDGLAMFRGSWCYQTTRRRNLFVFGRTAVGKAEVKFEQARDLLPKPQFGLSIMGGKGFQALSPGGQSEQVEAYIEAGFTYAALNVGDYPQEAWAATRQRLENGGLETIPWRRCFYPEDSEHLCSVVDAWSSALGIHNLEKEVESTHPLPVFAATVDRHPNQRFCIQTESWLQNDPPWHILGDRGVIASPESYLNMDARWEPAPLIDHARAEGMPLAVPTFGWGIWGDAHRDVPPSEYLSKWAGSFLVYHMITTDRSEILRWKR